jgi:hypothetical protein
MRFIPLRVCFAAKAATNSSPGAVAATAGGDHPFLQAGAAVDASNTDDKRNPSKFEYVYQAASSIYDSAGYAMARTSRPIQLP